MEVKERWKGLPKLVEEIGELGQVLGKLAAWPDGAHPDGGPPLQQRLKEEMADVIAAIYYVAKHSGVGMDEERIRAKLRRFEGWQLTGVYDGQEVRDAIATAHSEGNQE